MDQIEKLYDESVATKNQIIRANLRLVVSIAKRYVGPAGDFFELVSDGNMSLIRAADKFDFSRGNRFSTYASWAIMKNFARTIPNAFRQRSRFCTSRPEMLSTVEDVRPNHREQESAQIQRESHVERLLDRLDQRERQIVTSRFGLTRGQEPLTLKQVGADDRRLQRAGPADPVSGHEQIAQGCRGGPHRGSRVNNMQTLSLRWQTWMARQTRSRPRASESPLRDELFSVEQLARHAQALAANHQVVTGQGSNRLLARLGQNEDILQSFQSRDPRRQVQAGASLPPPNGCSTTST